MQIIILKFLLIIFLGVTNSLANNKNTSLENITLQLQWKHQFEFAGFYAAKEKGFYKELGLDVNFLEFNPTKNVIDSVLDGDADFGLSYSTIIADYMQAKPIILMANFFKQSPLVLITQKNIKTPADLKNKKIMGLLDSSHKNTVLSMLKKFNVTINDFQHIPRKFSLQSFVEKKVDAISAFTTNEVYELSKLGIDYNILDPAAFGIKFYDLNLFTTKSEVKNNPYRVENFAKASIRGWEYALEHKEEIIDIIIEKYNTQNKSKEALLYEAKQIEYLMLKNIYPIGSVDIQRVEMIADDYAQTLSLPKESMSNLKDFVYKTSLNTFELTQEQKVYLKEKKVIKMCIDPNWMPLEKIEDSKHVGISSDFIKIISKKIGTPIELVQTQLWSQSLANIKKRECDILALAEETPLRKNYLDFTTPYIKTPLVIATKSGVAFSNNLNSIKEKRLGVVKNYSIYELLKTKYPDINLIEVESLQEGLEYVDQKKIFGFLDNSLVINHEIQKNSMSDNINITGQFSEEFSLSIASRNDEPILNEILQKALISIDTETKDKIINKWNNIKYQVKTDYKTLIQLMFFTLVLICIFIYWNLKLKDEIKNKEFARKELKDAKLELEELNNSLEVKIKDEIEKNTKHQVMLMHQSKLAQMGEMIENIAHQWRQPLAQINSYVLLIDVALSNHKIKDNNLEDKLLEIESLTAYMSNYQ